MNKRIQELVIATDAWCDSNLPANWTDKVDEYLPVWNEKFAELIVRECLNKIENEAEQYAQPTWAFELVNDIKETFGVEE